MSSQLAEKRQAYSLSEDQLRLVWHELKTPLTSLSLSLQMALRATEEAGEAHGRLAAALWQCQSVIRIVNSLRDAAETGRFEPHPVQLDLGAVARAVTKAMEIEFRHRRTQVDVQCDSVYGMFDEAGVVEILFNLLSNAGRHGAGAPVHVAVHRSANSAVLTVYDEGPGIAPDVMDRLFLPWARSERSEGLGLGLFVVERWVDAHGGRISVESKPGGGASFEVELPLSPRRASAELVSVPTECGA